jgi:hypothetical protein
MIKLFCIPILFTLFFSILFYKDSIKDKFDEIWWDEFDTDEYDLW